MAGRVFTVLALALFVIGVGLLALNAMGAVVPLRNPDIYRERTHFSDDISLTYAEARQQLARRPGETDPAYAVRALRVVNQAVAHYWKDEGADRYRIHIPIWENYLLWAAGLLDPARYGKWEFADPDKGLERGVGLCSQHAIILADALVANGVPAILAGLDGHMVVMARMGPPNTWNLLDADYGVVVPYDLMTVERDPELVRPFYEAAGYSPGQVRTLVEIYDRRGNAVDPTGTRMYNSWRREQERRFYAGIWLIPAVLMLPYAGVLAGRGARRWWRRRSAPPWGT